MDQSEYSDEIQYPMDGVRVRNPMALFNLLKLLRNLSGDVVVNFYNGSLEIKVIDPSETKMVNSSTIADVTSNLVGKRISIDLDEAIKCFPKGTIKESDILEVDIERDRINFGVKQVCFSVKKIEQIPNDLPTPKINFTSTFEVRLQELLRGLSEIKGLSDAIELSFLTDAKTPCLCVAVNCETFEKLATMLIEHPLVDSSDRCTYELESLLRHLSSLKKISSKVKVGFGKKTPIWISAKDPTSPIRTIDYYQAPIVNT